MEKINDFLTEIEAFLARHAADGWSATRFGREAVGDPGFVFGLREGRSPSLRTVEKVLRFMKERGGLRD